ncbi:MAG: hypothetical protein WA660_00690, partial [Candidatus Acidiferrales bacterium]
VGYPLFLSYHQIQGWATRPYQVPSAIAFRRAISASLGSHDTVKRDKCSTNNLSHVHPSFI